MKFLAILRDSLREALDSKVIYVLLGLSALVIIGVASLSFKPQPAETGLQAILNRFPGAQQQFGQRQPPLRYALEKFEQTNDSRNPWDGTYSYDLVVTEAQPTSDEEDEKDDGKGKGKDKGPAPEKAPTHVFRLMVMVDYYLARSTEELSKEERETKRRILPLLWSAMRAQGGGLSRKEVKKLEADLAAELNRITPEQMELYIQRQLAAHGTLAVDSVKLTQQSENKFRFNVETRPRPETYRSWPHSVVLFFGALPLSSEGDIGSWVYRIEDTLVAGVGAGLAMLLSAIVTAFFIPNMLRKGSVDLLITKPIHRWSLLLFKYIGGLTFMFIITAAIVVGVWVVLGLRSGLWSYGFLLCIFILTFQFAIFYAVSALFGVLTRSPIVSILMACLTWGILFLTGWIHVNIITPTRDKAAGIEVFPSWVYSTSDTVHFILPRYKDLDVLTTQLIVKDTLGPDSPKRKETDALVKEIHWGESLGFTVGFIALLLGVAVWRFSVKDY